MIKFYAFTVCYSIFGYLLFYLRVNQALNGLITPLPIGKLVDRKIESFKPGIYYILVPVLNFLLFSYLIYVSISDNGWNQLVEILNDILEKEEQDEEN